MEQSDLDKYREHRKPSLLQERGPVYAAERRVETVRLASGGSVLSLEPAPRGERMDREFRQQLFLFIERLILIKLFPDSCSMICIEIIS